MKESNFHSDEFEELIREKTEQYKMYPSENVWKGVHNSLHTRRKWFIGSMALLVTGILFFAGRELLVPGHSFSKQGTIGASPDRSYADNARTGQPEDNVRSNFVRLRAPNGGNAVNRHINIAGSAIAGQEEPDQPYNHLSITISHPVVSQPDLSELLSHAVQLPGEAPSLIAAGGPAPDPMAGGGETSRQGPGLLDSWLVRNAPDNAGRRSTEAAVTRNNSSNPTEALRDPAEPARDAELTGSRESGREIDADDGAIRGVLESLSSRSRRDLRKYGSTSRTPSVHRGAVETNIRDSAGSVRASTDVAGEESDASRVNWLHDYAVYSLPPSPSRGRLFFQLNLAPTVNFRSLSGGDMAASKQVGGPVGGMKPAVNWVDQSPGLGFEFGGNLLYRATRNLTLKIGVQFDYSRYKMQAYSTAPQQQQQPTYRTPLGNYLYMDSLFSAQPASVNGGPILPNPVQATLYNDYFQLAMPVGFELRVLGNERLQFNVGASVQPSYLINTNAYVVTPDYTSYTKEPSAFRRWNVSGAVEAFLSYQTGQVRWQVGPEFRYQLFSSYNSGPYPISENLHGYGLKIGITKPLP